MGNLCDLIEDEEGMWSGAFELTEPRKKEVERRRRREKGIVGCLSSKTNHELGQTKGKDLLPGRGVTL